MIENTDGILNSSSKDTEYEAKKNAAVNNFLMGIVVILILITGYSAYGVFDVIFDDHYLINESSPYSIEDIYGWGYDDAYEKISVIRLHGKDNNEEYKLSVAIGDYERAAFLQYAYEYVGDEEKDVFYAGKKAESKKKMIDPTTGKSRTEYADIIDGYIETFRTAE